MSIARSSAVDALSQAGSIAASLAAGIAISRVLGDEGQGAYVLATATASLLLINLANLGLGLSVQVFAAKDPRRAPELHTLVVLVSVVAGAVAGGGVLLLRPQLQAGVFRGMEDAYFVALALGLPFLLYKFCTVGLLNGLGAVRPRAVIELAVNVLQSAVILWLLLGAGGAPLFGDATLGVLVVAYYGIFAAECFVLGHRVSRHARLWSWPRWELVRRVFGYGKWIYVGNFASRLRSIQDQLLVNYFGGAGALGVYHRGAGLASRVNLFPKALAAASYARITAGDDAEAGRLVAAGFRQMLLLAIPLCVVGWLASPLIPVIYGEDFRASIWPFRLLVVAYCVLGGAQVLAIYFSGKLVRPQVPMAINWITIAVQLAAAVGLAGLVGPLNAVLYATAGAHLLTTGLFLGCFLARPETPGMRELFVFRREDLDRWVSFLAAGRSAGKR